MFKAEEYPAICGLQGTVTDNFRSMLGTWTAFNGTLPPGASLEFIKCLQADFAGFNKYIGPDYVRIIFTDRPLQSQTAWDYLQRKRRLRRQTRFLLEKLGGLPESLSDLVAKLVE